MYNPYMVGRKVYLRYPMEKDVEGRWPEWFSDENTTKYLIDRYWPNSKEEQYNFFKSIQNNHNRMVLSIIDKESDDHIGVASLGAINWVHRYCDFAIVIGEEKYRKGVYAIDCMALLLRIAFKRLNLRNVKGAYVRSNDLTKGMVKLFHFKEIGVYEKLYWISGGWEDSVVVILNREDWMKRNSE